MRLPYALPDQISRCITHLLDELYEHRRSAVKLRRNAAVADFRCHYKSFRVRFCVQSTIITDASRDYFLFLRITDPIHQRKY